MSKRSKKVAVKGKAKVKRKVVVKRRKAAKKAKAYDIHSGKPARGREVGAMQRLEKLTEKYVAEGMSPADARNRARAEMRGSRMDWRAG